MLVRTIVLQRGIACAPEALCDVDAFGKARKKGALALLTVDQLRAIAAPCKYNCGRFAELLRVSPRHLRRLFLARFGCSADRWLYKERLKAALRLLLSHSSVKEVAYELGFSHPAQFSRDFRKRFGITPLRYRLALGRTLSAELVADEVATGMCSLGALQDEWQLPPEPGKGSRSRQQATRGLSRPRRDERLNARCLLSGSGPALQHVGRHIGALGHAAPEMLQDFETNETDRCSRCSPLRTAAGVTRRPLAVRTRCSRASSQHLRATNDARAKLAAVARRRRRPRLVTQRKRRPAGCRGDPVELLAASPPRVAASVASSGYPHTPGLFSASAAEAAPPSLEND